jgi:hypothetical protein
MAIVLKEQSQPKGAEQRDMAAFFDSTGQSVQTVMTQL